jgi:hypothetical protein
MSAKDVHTLCLIAGALGVYLAFPGAFSPKEPSERESPTVKQRVFRRWCGVLTLVWVFANWPRTFGLAGAFQAAGFPLVFWNGRECNLPALAVDSLLGVGVVLGLSALCAWSRPSPNEAMGTTLKERSSSQDAGGRRDGNDGQTVTH